MGKVKKSLEERFWAKVDKTPGYGSSGDCWVWTARVGSHGYGEITISDHMGKRVVNAHRVSYEISNGAIPSGLLVRHKCDFRICVNPLHLEVGTHQDNSNDCVSRGRTPKGENHYRRTKTYKTIEGEKNGRAKLTTEQVLSIRSRVASGEKRSELAKEFGVSWTAINKAVNGDNWSKALNQLEVK